MLADSDDLKTLDCDLEIDLNGEVCDWLTATAVAWLKDTVAHAVGLESTDTSTPAICGERSTAWKKSARRAMRMEDIWAWGSEPLECGPAPRDRFQCGGNQIRRRFTAHADKASERFEK